VYEDIEQIKQLHIRYVNALTFIKWNDAIDRFAEDSSLDVQYSGLIKGKDNIAHFFREMLPQIHIGKEGIFTVHPLIEVDGDRAKGNWLMYMMYADHRIWQSASRKTGTELSSAFRHGTRDIGSCLHAEKESQDKPWKSI
jgi:hypothetical protein